MPAIKKVLECSFSMLLKNNGWKKLSNPTVTRGATAIPQNKTAVARIGLRLDYNNFIEKEGVRWHQFKLQVNAGDTIPKPLKRWRDKHPKGTHAVMATIEIREGADENEVKAALMEATKDVRGV